MAKQAPTANSLEEYSTTSLDAHEKGKELEREWNSLIGCCSGGTGQSVSRGMLLLLSYLDDDKGILGKELWWWRVEGKDRDGDGTGFRERKQVMAILSLQFLEFFLDNLVNWKNVVEYKNRKEGLKHDIIYGVFWSVLKLNYSLVMISYY